MSFSSVFQILQITELVGPLLRFLSLREVLFFRQVLSHILPAEEIQKLYLTLFQTTVVLDKVTFVFQDGQLNPNVVPFFEWVLTYGVQLTQLVFIGPKNWEFSLQMTRFLRDPRNRSARSLRFLSIFNAKLISPALFETIGDHCTELQEIDVSVTNMGALEFFKLVKRLPNLQTLVIAQGDIAWRILTEFMPAKLRVLVVLETVICWNIVNPPDFVSALRQRCTDLQRVDVTVHKFGNPNNRFRKAWVDVDSTVPAAEPLRTYEVHATQPLAVLLPSTTPEAMRRIYTGV